MYRVEPEGQPRPPAAKAWRLLRAPVIGVALGLLLVKGVEALRRARMSPDERRDTAEAHCERAREIQDEACRRLNVAPIYLPKDVIGDMIREYSRALDADPGCTGALHDRAYWHWFRGDRREARADYDELLRRAPGNAQAWYQSGRMRCESGDHAGAVEDYTKSFEIEGHRPGSAVLGARARCRREQGDYRGALADLVAEGGYDYRPIGECHEALGQRAEAIAAFEQYLARSEAGDIRYRLGLLKFAAGDRAGALRDLHKACQVSSEMLQKAAEFVQSRPADPLSEVLREAMVLEPERE